LENQIAKDLPNDFNNSGHIVASPERQRNFNLRRGGIFSVDLIYPILNSICKKQIAKIIHIARDHNVASTKANAAITTSAYLFRVLTQSCKSVSSATVSSFA
jgi:hypothetical protein